VLATPFNISLILSDQGSLIDDSTFVTPESLDYFGQVSPNPKASSTLSPYARIFLDDSLYEGQVKNQEANGIGRIVVLDKAVDKADVAVIVYGYWKDGSMIGSF